MPSQNDNLKRLEQELLAYCEVHSRSSKSRKIRALFNTIQYVIDDGLSLDHVVSFLNQNEIPVSKNTLKVYLYRIRKERGNTPNSKPIKTITKENQASPTPTYPSNSEESTETKINPYDLMMEKYKQCNNQVDKYIALGGKREDIEEQNISTQRGMVMTLRNQLRQKYKGIY
ncbi:TPA: hypothetical protein ACRZ4F_005069 [Vibrio harveyi]